MSKRNAQEITMALVALQDARRAVNVGATIDALAALEDAAARLDSVPHTSGIPIAQAAPRLEVSQPKVRAFERTQPYGIQAAQPSHSGWRIKQVLGRLGVEWASEIWLRPHTSVSRCQVQLSTLA